jgi:hypothetical protein
MRKLLILHIILLFSVFAWSQQGTTPARELPYECGFEHDSLLTHWVLNASAPASTVDKWMVGTAVHSEGKRSLYISKDGTNPNYGKTKNVVVSYLRYKFPTATSQQNYELSFDWKGIGDSTDSRLYVMVCPEIALTQTGGYNLNSIVTNAQGRLSNATLAVCQAMGESGEKFVCGSESWQNVVLSNEIRVNPTYSSQIFAIAFIWVNANQVDSINRSSIAIDNVQINSAALKKPTNLQVTPQCEDSTLLISWESGLQEFDIEYRKVGSPKWSKANGLTDGMSGFTRVDGTKCSYVLTRILEGSYEVRVRGVADDLRTSFVYKTNILVYCPENHCINYIDLHNPNVVCTYGHHPGAQAGATPYDNIGIIDFGPDAEESRHTLHIDPTELDPRTDSLLPTVPDGALASVRLGNWKYGGEAESITYDILVDSTNQGILIVKYAIVFENPNGHPPEDEPAFKLEVLGPNGLVIDELCGQANFTYSDGAAEGAFGWHMTKDNNVAWKEWTTVGLNLMPYHAQTIKVRFTTLDCGWSGHFAYAYFTVDCANAHIETNNCGNDASITCKAPDGFAYEWRNEVGDVVSTNQELSVDASRQTYTCRVSFVEQPACYFEISTLSAPRFPVPEYTVEPIYEECTSKLKFHNTSHVMNKFEGFENHTDEPCVDFHWEFKRLSNGDVKMTDAQHPIFLCPAEGGLIEVKYTCYIGEDNACDSTRVDTIDVRSIIPQNTVFYETTCPEAPVKFGDCATCWYSTDTTVVLTYPNFAGCDSTSTLHLTVYPFVEDTYRHDSICSDGSVTINGVRYNQPMENQLIMLKTQHGCDSALYFTLTVNERLNASVENEPFVCADAEQLYLYLHITAGVFDSLEITFDTPELPDTVIYDYSQSTIAIPYPETITPGVYRVKMKFYQFCCGIYTEEHEFEIRYRSSIVEQKWNDVLTVLSPKYNGGFEFTAFQWYKDGMPLDGETHSYLYQPLDMNAIYYVELTRADGLVMTTCPIQPVYHEQQTPFPTVVPAGQHMPMYMEQATTIWYYTISGQLYSTFGLPQGYTTLPIPEQNGAYIIKSTNAQGQTQAQVMIVQ